MAECQVPQLFGNKMIKPPDLVLVIGGEGILGGSLFYNLLRSEFNVRCAIKMEDEEKVDRKPGVEFFYCDPLNAEIPESAFRGVRYVVNTVSPMNTGSMSSPDMDAFERLNNMLITRVKSAGISRYILLSSLRVSDKEEEGWAFANWRNEFSLMNSGVPYTILRTGLIVCPQNAKILVDIGGARGLLSVFSRRGGSFHVTPSDMLSLAISRCICETGSLGRTYAVSADRALTGRELYAMARNLGGKGGADRWEGEIQAGLSSEISGNASRLEDLQMDHSSFETVPNS